jgi:general secretion pathway protein I
LKKIQTIREGFTLIEVAIALALAASIMVWTYSMISQGMQKQREAIALTNAVFLAKIKMAQIDAIPKLETTTAQGDIPGYIGYKYDLEIKEEELDLLKLAEGGSKKKEPTDLLGKDTNSQFSELLKKRGKDQSSKTGGIIKVFRIRLRITYPSGSNDEVYEVETIKSTNY